MATQPPKTFNRFVDTDALHTIWKALCAAEHEIHNPGCARAGNYDVVDLIAQAKEAVDRAFASSPL